MSVSGPEDLPVSQRVVRRPSRMSISCREALPDVREWSGGRPGCPQLVGRPSLKSGIVRETLPNVREWSGGHPK